MCWSFTWENWRRSVLQTISQNQSCCRCSLVQSVVSKTNLFTCLSPIYQSPIYHLSISINHLSSIYYLSIFCLSCPSAYHLSMDMIYHWHHVWIWRSYTFKTLTYNLEFFLVLLEMKKLIIFRAASRTLL